MSDVESSKKEYSFAAKLLHLGFVVLFAYGIFKQIDNIEQLEDFALLRFEVIFALAFVVILLGRLYYMSKTQESSLPDNTPKPQRLAAKAVHLGMYASLAAIACSGLAIGLLFWLGMKEGLLIEMVISVHEFSVALIYWLIAVHVGAAIFHRFKNDGVWSSMVPILKEDRD